MSLKLIEGYDHMGTAAKLAVKGWTFTPSSRAGESSTLTFTSGRINGNCARHSTPGGGVGTMSQGSLKKTLPASYATLVQGFALRLSALPASATDLFTLMAGGTQTVRVRVASSGAISILNSGGTTIATGAAAAVSAGNWIFIEVKAFINGASGTVEVKTNGGAYIASTVGNFGSSNLDGIASLANYNEITGTIDVDDVYALDTTGDNADFLGDSHVETLYPSADGANTNFTPDTGTAHYSRVNEHTGTYPDDDTSYVYSSTAGHRDTYVTTDLSALSGAVFGVQVNLYARKDDAATRQIAPVIRQGGSNFDGTTQTLSLSYAVYSQIYDNDTASADWTVSSVNNSEFGVKLVA